MQCHDHEQVLLWYTMQKGSYFPDSVPSLLQSCTTKPWCTDHKSIADTQTNVNDFLCIHFKDLCQSVRELRFCFSGICMPVDGFTLYLSAVTRHRSSVNLKSAMWFNAKLSLCGREGEMKCKVCLWE